MNSQIAYYIKLSENAYSPTRGSKFAAGLDLYSAYDYIVPSKGKVLVQTDLQLVFPSGCYGRIASRSGFALKYFIEVGAGVIDPDYTGNVCVLLYNFGDSDFSVSKGMKVAQVIVEKYSHVVLLQVDFFDRKTERENKGFGSSDLVNK